MSHLQRKYLVIVGAIFGLAAIVASEPRAAEERRQGNRARQELPRPIVDTHHLMELFNQPLYQYLREAMQEKPTDKQGWKTLEERGLQAAEVMNLVAIREIEDVQRTKWDQHVRTALKAALQLNESAKAQDWEQTRSAYQALVKNCNDCHKDIAPDHAPEIEL